MAFTLELTLAELQLTSWRWHTSLREDTGSLGPPLQLLKITIRALIKNDLGPIFFQLLGQCLINDLPGLRPGCDINFLSPALFDCAF